MTVVPWVKVKTYNLGSAASIWRVKKIERWIVVNPEGVAKIVHPFTGDHTQFLTEDAAQFLADKLNEGET